MNTIPQCCNQFYVLVVADLSRIHSLEVGQMSEAKNVYPPIMTCRNLTYYIITRL